MTNLDKDIVMAEKLGYGVHYGWYKADHPVTRSTEPEAKPIQVECVCQHCGNTFYHPRHNQKYCCTRCQQLAGMKRYHQKRKNALSEKENKDDA